MDKKAVICFENYTFQYHSQEEPTLRDINLTIYEGEKILIVGPSGSGKSTLGHCLNGLIPLAYKGEHSGTLFIHGENTDGKSIFSLSKMVGTVLQDADGQFVGLSVAEDIAFSLENDNVEQAEMKLRVANISKLVDMDVFLQSSPHELSGGQKQRVSLAGVMVDDVDILLFDEPLANLDPATGKTAIALIHQIHQTEKKTILIIEHRLEDVLHCDVDRIIVMNDGRIIADADPHTIVSGNILTEQGIREPLYIAACKYANIPIVPSMRPAHINTCDISGYEAQLVQWFDSVKKPAPLAEEKKLLEIRNLSFSYDGVKPILCNIQIDIHEKEMISIVGRNGAGKSTLSKIIVGFEKEDSGVMLLHGEDMSTLTIKERGERIGIVLQNPNQMISKNLIFDEIAFGLRNAGIDEQQTEQRVLKIMKVCGLLPFRSWPISALSYGQKKRVTIACILVLNPSILILDEPTAGQDFRHYSEIMEFLSELNRNGQTILLITHDMHLMLEYTPRAIVLSDGEKVADKRASDILCDRRIIEKANLKETSLFALALKANIREPIAFVQAFIDYEKGNKANEN